MNSQASESVFHVDRRKTWSDAVFASFRASDRHVSDDDIFEILNAGSEGETAADLCAAKGVAVPMYCVWKAKYRNLSLEELRNVRRRELWRARCVLGVLLTAAALGTGGIVFGLARVTNVNTTGAAAVNPAIAPATPTNPESPMSGNVRAASAPTVPTSESAPAERKDNVKIQPDTAVAPAPAEVRIEPALVSPASPTSTTEQRYNVQVAASPTLEEGRKLADKLASAGHPAYVLPASVRDVEVYRVRVGPFETLAEAEDVSRKLRRDGYDGAWIVR